MTGNRPPGYHGDSGDGLQFHNVEENAMTTKTAEEIAESILSDGLAEYAADKPGFAPYMRTAIATAIAAERQRADTLASSLAQTLERVKELRERVHVAMEQRDEAEAALATALAAGRSKGLDEAATWHDGLVDHWQKTIVIGVSSSSCLDRADTHRSAAAFFRELASSPLPVPGSPIQAGMTGGTSTWRARRKTGRA